MSFPQSFVEEVRLASNIVSIVSAYVPLKKAGRSHKGLCPFHSEKTPSFNVDGDRGFFHCFGCGVGGDVFAFVMQHERLGFPEAVRTVATMSGMTVPDSRDSAAEDRVERLHRVQEAALEIFRETLARPQGMKAREYLKGRGLEDSTVETFEIGLTPEGWEEVTRGLSRRQYTTSEILASGLAKERASGGGLYDRFHDRIIFPIRNSSGRLVGFGGRSLAGQAPKYLNSPETELYRKSEILYGLNAAKDAIRRAERVVLVEGYMDLILLHQSGVTETVASLGTSLTAAHARLLARHARSVVIAYDGDAAGRSAARRAFRVLLPESLEIGVVTIRDGKDPDDFVREHGAEAFRTEMKAAAGLVPFLVAEHGATTTPEAKVKLVNEVLPLLALVEDPIERAVQVGRLAEVAGIEDGVVREGLRRAAADRKTELLVESIPERAEWLEAEGILLMALLTHPESQEFADLDPTVWRGLGSTLILDRAWAARSREASETVASLLQKVESALDRDRLGGIAMRHTEITVAGGRSAYRTLEQRVVGAELAAIQRQISNSTDEEMDRLLARKQDLSRRMDRLRQDD